MNPFLLPVIGNLRLRTKMLALRYGKQAGMTNHREIRIWSYTLPGGWRVSAGKTDADNDRLSIREAHPADWWFHVRGMPGSHVILHHREGMEPDRETLQRAAAVAAWHSKARHDGTVAVSCTRAQYVTKPRGAKPGTVSIRRESVIKTRPGLPEAALGD